MAIRRRPAQVAEEFHDRLDKVHKQLNEEIRQMGLKTKVSKTSITRAMAWHIPEIKLDDVLFSKMRRNRKGSILDQLGIPIILLVMFVFFFTLGYLVLQLYTAMNDSGAIAADDLQPLKQVNDNWIPISQSGLLFLMFGLQLVSIIGAFQIRTSKALFWISWIFLLVFTLVSWILRDVYVEITRVGFFAELITQYGLFDFFMLQLPIFTCLFGFVVMIVMYAKGD